MAAFLAPLALLGWTTSNASAPTLVETPQGKVQGLMVNGFRIFRGIPYAEPPLGDKRWRPPMPSAPWSDVFDATQLARPCIQPSGPDSWASMENMANMSEDCNKLPVLKLSLYDPPN